LKANTEPSKRPKSGVILKYTQILEKPKMNRAVLLLLFPLILSCKKTETTLFESIPTSKTNISFINQLTETPQDNVLNYEYFYNGGGVAAGDFNNDGLIDLFFTGNQVGNTLYLNKGNLQFEDITEKANVINETGAWNTGVSLVDINADGLLDMYISRSGLRDESLRKNQLFINKGVTNGIPQFSEEAEIYGLDDSGYSSQAAFLDYDRDGDLDCFLINHNVSGYERKEAHVMRAAYDYDAGDKLFRNDGIDSTTKAVKFVDVSVKSGIKGNPLGFGLGVSVSDVNQDGFLDIYVANDFVEDDYLYMNQGDGTFKDELRENLEHTSYSSMGVDIADLNNDLLPDIITTDMLPEDNARQKLLIWPDNWNVYQAQLNNGFWHQNMRNMLHVNNGNGTFSEIGQLAGISNTDWSWAALAGDFDLDGYKDIFISNGIGRDFTNIDFIKYSSETRADNLTVLETLKGMSSSQTKNYIFKNNGNLTFTNQQKRWGFDTPTISTGVIAADLDNDGDLDIVTNNLNEVAKVYKNTSQENEPKPFVKLHLKGINGNPQGVGAKIILTDSTQKQLLEIDPTTGYLSSNVSDVIFATQGKNVTVEVYWANNTYQKIRPKLNAITEIDQKNAVAVNSEATIETKTTFQKDNGYLSFEVQLPYSNDFEQQVLLPQHYSYFGPKLVKADINKDGYQDVIVAGNSLTATALFIGNAAGKLQKISTNFGLRNVQNITVADFNNDGFPDLYFAIGDYKNTNPTLQNDEIWLNNSKGSFHEKWDMTDGIFNKTAVASDFDNNGTMDVFLGGFIKPLQYPKIENSYLFLQTSKAKNGFVKKEIAAYGLITDAVQINQQEIILVGEWMSPTITSYQNGTFKQTKDAIPPNLSGWWNCIKKSDLDGDGDDDFVLGNIGRNSQFNASAEEPASLTYGDFDENGITDNFMEYYIQGKAYPPYSRDEVSEQLPMLRRKFLTYKEYSTATFSDFFEKEILKKATKKQIQETETLVLENQNGKYVIHRLPIQAQYSSVFDVLIEDINQDGKKDIVLVGNNSMMRLRMGKIDANFGQLFVNTGNFDFQYVPQKKSGLAIKGDARSIISIDRQLLIGISNGFTQCYKY
jgi:hypothetical protein